MASGLRLAFRQPLFLGHGCNAAVLRPQSAVAQPGRREQMGIDVADAPAHQVVAIKPGRGEDESTMLKSTN